MYFLVKREIAHTTNFLPLLELAKSLGASSLSDIQLGGNATYTSERFMQEFIQCLGESVSGPLLVQVRSHLSLHYALMKKRMCL